MVVLEPQEHLCRLINYAAQRNGPAVARRIRLFNNAALDARETISLAQADIAEGAIATVVRGGTGDVEALPIADFLPVGAGRICFLKIDVEARCVGRCLVSDRAALG